jgi:histidyl-tRNA synthetase
MNLSIGVTEDKWVATCVLVDKLEKVPVSALKGELVELDLTEEAVSKLLDSLKVRRSNLLSSPVL